MKISACYITKNEEANLPESLAGVKAIVDEIIVVDTGSTDKTREIAAEYGAKVYSLVWQDDFSQPRNYALEHAAGDWIIFLDADEILKDIKKKALVDWLSDHDDQLVGMMWMKHIDVDTQQILMENMAPRILQNHPALRYAGRIHEQLRYNGNSVRDVCLCPASVGWLLHTGYTSSRMKAKAERNLRLLLPELEQENPPQDIDMYLAEAYDGLEDWERAAYYAKRDIAKGRRNILYASRSWTMLLRLYASRPAYVQERLEIALSAVEHFPEIPLFHAELAECYAATGNFDGACHAFARALQAYDDFQQGLEPQSLTAEQIAQIRKRMELLKRQIHYPEQWELARREAVIELHRQNEATVVQLLPELLQLIIRLQQEPPSRERDETLIRLTSYLPAEYEAFWQYELGLSDHVSSQMADIYVVMLSYILQYGDEEQRRYYTAQALQWTADCFYRAIDVLLKHEQWQLAWTLLEQIAADSDWMRAEYWFAAGLCLFYQNESAAALECFSRAKDAGFQEQDKELEAYIQWAGEEA